MNQLIYLIFIGGYIFLHSQAPFQLQSTPALPYSGSPLHEVQEGGYRDRQQSSLCSQCANIIACWWTYVNRQVGPTILKQVKEAAAVEIRLGP